MFTTTVINSRLINHIPKSIRFEKFAKSIAGKESTAFMPTILT